MLMRSSPSLKREEFSLPALRARWRDHEDVIAAGRKAPDIRLLIAASFNAHNLVPFVGDSLLDSGLFPSIRLAPYNQLFQVCADPPRHLDDSNCALLLWRIEDLMLEELARFSGGEHGALGGALEKLDQLIDAALQMRRAFAGTLIFAQPPFPTHGPGSLSWLPRATSPLEFHAAMIRRQKERLDIAGGIHLLDLAAVQADFGISASLDWRQWYLFRQPFRETFLRQAAARIARLIRASRAAPKKCVVLDADNTLWGGIVGEAGLEGIALGDEFPGSAYRDFQQVLLRLRSQGLLLAVVSKNNADDVREVFDRHQGMVLKREHISAWGVSWQPKADGIAAIARTLGIGRDALVFIDDSAIEIAQMKEAWPEVACVQVPDEPAEIVPFIQRLDYFDNADVTEEDRNRADMMRAESDRAGLGALSLEAFQQALELKIAFRSAADHQLGRITQLINKTNQFNLTTIRRSLDEVRALSASPRHRIYALEVKDKFGDYGLSGVVIAEIDRPKWRIDTMLLSCRVLGRGVEKALLALFAEEARRHGAQTITASFAPTEKNAPAGAFLPEQGFSPIGGNDWCIGTAQIPPLDESIARL